MNDKPEIIVLYVDRDNNNALHQILLNPLELKSLGAQITDIFARKGSEVLVGDKVLRLFEEVSEDGKEDSRSIQD